MPKEERDGTRGMLKSDQINNPESCLNRAKDDELVFVLIGRDPAAPIAIRAWIDERIRLGKNKAGDHQIADAINIAAIMEQRSR